MATSKRLTFPRSLLVSDTSFLSNRRRNETEKRMSPHCSTGNLLPFSHARARCRLKDTGYAFLRSSMTERPVGVRRFASATSGMGCILLLELSRAQPQGVCVRVFQSHHWLSRVLDSSSARLPRASIYGVGVGKRRRATSRHRTSARESLDAFEATVRIDRPLDNV
ncbi:hypothetical protein PHSY_006203 [Pseudozyma hubeiensis SY62]|uniref:Uncharacterized protein n=1 Tax=Pseudozyma hubeiensis (strain SY62) TaxID=1305764 RepID=R9PB82_PSEHS|nr:hypothetical protein PHSY_006203 [Pseudozyma hubeiensis SY62]GAC98609.1 hypothetical protein PHSY_006203 [Pseudozyma hubeiensis SY62]